MEWFYLGIVIVLILAIFFNVKTFRCFCNSGFVKTIASIMGVLFTIIGIFVGIFAENLTQHSNEYHNRYWFTPKNIIEFPIEQLKYHALQSSALDSLLKDEKVKTGIINDIANKIVLNPDTNKVDYIFVIDKTASGKQNTRIPQKILSELRENVESRIKEQLKYRYKLDTKYFPYREDLLLVSCILAISDSCNQKNIGSQVFVYRGENKDTVEGDFIQIKSDDILTFLKDYKEKYVKHNGFKSKLYTNFNSVINKINHSYLPTNNSKTVITIFSDFLHEDRNTESFEQLNTNIGNFINKIRQSSCSNQEPNVLINLIKLNVNNPTFVNNNKIEETLNLFRKHFHFEHKKTYTESEILEAENINERMAQLTTYIRKDRFYYETLEEKEKISNLIFYYPFSIGKMEQIHSSYVKFKIEGENKNIQPNVSFINISDNSVCPTKFIFRLININTCETITLSEGETNEGEFIKFSLDTTSFYIASIDACKIPNNLVLNIATQGRDSIGCQTIKEQIPIQFKTLTPKILCYVLIISITLFGILLATLLIYFCFRLTICRYAYYKSEHMAKITGWLVAFITGYFAVKVLITLVCYCIELYCIESIDYIHEGSFFLQHSFTFLFLVLILSISLILLISRVYEYKHKNIIHLTFPFPSNCPYRSVGLPPTTATGQDKDVLILWFCFGIVIAFLIFLLKF